MKGADKPCALIWMAEAAEDGRIGATDRAVFERHCAACAVCTAQAAELAELRKIFGQLPVPEMSNLDHRRQRRTLMARAGGVAMGRMHIGRWSVSLAAFSLAGVALVVLGTGWALRNRKASPVVANPASDLPALALEQPAYEITGLRGAVWSEERNGTVARVTLSEGSAAFHVHHLRPDQRFLVTLPDGEVEVRGTRFVVDINGGRTRYVVVMDGKVAFRQAGRGEQLLVAGDRWDGTAAVPAPVLPGGVKPVAGVSPTGSASVPAAQLASSSPLPSRRTGRLHRTSGGMGDESHDQPVSRTLALESPAANASQVIAPEPSVPAIPAPLPSSVSVSVRPEGNRPAADLFARGVVAFRAGRYGEAETHWKLFLASFPGDPRNEDVSFLRAVGRSRAGDKAGAAALARDYLLRFPTGMRRREAEALSSLAPRSARH